jgi:hypothetical protein
MSVGSAILLGAFGPEGVLGQSDGRPSSGQGARPDQVV